MKKSRGAKDRNVPQQGQEQVQGFSEPTRKGLFGRRLVWTLAALGIAAVASVAVAGYFKYRDAKPYLSTTVTLGTLERTISATGEVKPAARLDLSFERGGIVESVLVQVGDTVHAGDVLAELKNRDVQFAYQSAQASLLAASANLQRMLAGEKYEVVNIAKQNVSRAQADLDLAKTDLENAGQRSIDAIRQAELKVQAAQNSLANNASVYDQSILDAYDSLRLALISSIGPMNTALADGDQIIGVDDTATNQTYKYLLGVWDSGSMDRARVSYSSAKKAKLAADTVVKSLRPDSLHTAILSAELSIEQALLLIQAYLHDVQQVLATSITGQGFSASDLANSKTRINADLSTVTAELNGVISKKQAAATAVLQKDANIQKLQDALDAANVDLRAANTSADTSLRSAKAKVSIQQAALDAANADLALKESPPRDVDLAPLRATVSEAQAAFEQAKNDLLKIRIIAPVNGTITEILPELGEIVVQNAPAIRMFGEDEFEIEAQIPEADIAVVAAGRPVSMTLDAYGDGTRFAGNVLTIDPDQTLVQNAVYYKTKVSIDPAGRTVKPGMTANVRLTGSVAVNALLVPSAYLQTDSKGVISLQKRLPDGEVRTIPVSVIARGDKGLVAIGGDIAAGDEVVTAASP